MISFLVVTSSVFGIVVNSDCQKNVPSKQYEEIIAIFFFGFIMSAVIVYGLYTVFCILKNQIEKKQLVN